MWLLLIVFCTLRKQVFRDLVITTPWVQKTGDIFACKIRSNIVQVVEHKTLHFYAWNRRKIVQLRCGSCDSPNGYRAGPSWCRSLTLASVFIESSMHMRVSPLPAQQNSTDDQIYLVGKWRIFSRQSLAQERDWWYSIMLSSRDDLDR